MKRLIKADFFDILSLIPVYQPVDPDNLAQALIRLQREGRREYLFLARREKCWLLDPREVRRAGSYANLCWLVCRGLDTWPVIALYLQVEDMPRGRPTGNVTLLDYEAVVQEMASGRARRIRRARYCTILDAIQYFKTGR